MTDRRILIAALVLGAIAAGLAVAFLASADGGSASGSGSAAAETRSVVVATEEIPAGTRITAGMLEARDVPVSAIISNAATDVDAVVGETARYPIAEGEQLNAVRLVAPVQVQSLSFQIPEGMRGYTIPVSTNESPAALVAPGDFIDVLLAADSENLVTPSSVFTSETTSTVLQGNGLASDRQAVATILQNIQVLTVERTYVENGVQYDASVRGAPPEDGGVSYITLALTPEEAQFLWLAMQEGDLTFTLRAFGDDSIADVGAISGLRTQQR